MIEGRPFLYQALDGIVYRVNEHGVQLDQHVSLLRPVIAFWAYSRMRLFSCNSNIGFIQVTGIRQLEAGENELIPSRLKSFLTPSRVHTV